MGELVWFALYHPKDLDLGAVTALVRPLVSRPRLGLMRRTPVVAFELWMYRGKIRWLLGMERSLSARLPAQLEAQVPKLHILRCRRPRRPVPLAASNVCLTGRSQLVRLDMATAVSTGLLEALRSLSTTESAVVQWTVGPARSRKVLPVPVTWPARVGLVSSTPPDAAELRLWRLKVAEPLFMVRGRIGARAASLERARAVVRLLADALSLANASHAEVRATKPTAWTARRLPRVGSRFTRWSGIANAAELAVLLGFPLADGAPATGHGVYLNPAPPRLLISAEMAAQHTGVRVVGESLHPADQRRLMMMPTSTALHHVHVIGPTGSGKSDFLAGLGRADAAAWLSLLVMEPKGDLVDQVLAGVPAARHGEVVVIEPGHHERVVGMNPLAGPRADAERRADQLLELFDGLYGTGLGPRSRDVLLHSLIALARSPGGTLADLPVLLTNPSFRRGVLATVNDPLVLAPFFAWYDGLSDAQRSTVITPVLNKTRSFLSRSVIRRFLGQAEPGFTLEELFTQRRIVLVNLNRGVIGDQAASLIGASLLTQLWQAVQRRALVPPEQRHPVMVIVDEVQNYLRQAVVVREMLEQARGLGVSLTLAHQALGQLAPPVRAAVMANARSRIVFRPGPDDAKRLATALGGEVDAATLNQLGAFEACVRLLVGHALTEPFAVKTRRLPPGESEADWLHELSRRRYGVDGTELDAMLTRRWQGGSEKPDGPIGIKRRAA